MQILSKPNPLEKISKVIKCNENVAKKEKLPRGYIQRVLLFYR